MTSQEDIVKGTFLPKAGDEESGWHCEVVEYSYMSHAIPLPYLGSHPWCGNALQFHTSMFLVLGDIAQTHP